MFFLELVLPAMASQEPKKKSSKAQSLQYTPQQLNAQNGAATECTKISMPCSLSSTTMVPQPPAMSEKKVLVVGGDDDMLMLLDFSVCVTFCFCEFSVVMIDVSHCCIRAPV